MLDAPQIVDSDAQLVAVIRLTSPRDQMRTAIGPGVQELMGVVGAQGIGPTGPWPTRHYRMDPGVFDFEIGVPVSAPVTPTGCVRAGELPQARVVRAVHHGSYEGLPGAWSELNAWIEANGLAPGEQLGERYLAGPESGAGAGSWRTELNRPVIG